MDRLAKRRLPFGSAERLARALHKGSGLAARIEQATACVAASPPRPKNDTTKFRPLPYSTAALVTRDHLLTSCHAAALSVPQRRLTDSLLVLTGPAAGRQRVYFVSAHQARRSVGGQLEAEPTCRGPPVTRVQPITSQRLPLESNQNRAGGGCSAFSALEKAELLLCAMPLVVLHGVQCSGILGGVVPQPQGRPHSVARARVEPTSRNDKHINHADVSWLPLIFSASYPLAQPPSSSHRCT